MTTTDGEPPGERADRRQRLLHEGMQRFDFLAEIDHERSTADTIVERYTPDPRRYDTLVRDGETYFVDRYTDMAISLATICEAFDANSDGVAAFYLPARIGDARRYAQDRFQAVRDELETGEFVPPSVTPAAHRPLILSDETPVTFLSIDVCGATRMQAEDPEGFERAFTLAFQELATAVNQFHASIYKTTGDGFIAYIDHPSVTARDSAIDLGMSMLLIMRESVNPALQLAGLRPIEVRIGADHGNARMRTLRSRVTGFEQSEVISDALNRAVKLQEAAKPGTMLIGEALRHQLHVGWLERATPADNDVADAVGIPDYRSFVID